jgi:glycosyltransferase involved in cell wall biosynthesis
MHFELPALLRRCGPADVMVEDLSHVVPFLAERLTQAPGVVFFRHLHRRTLPGQVSPPTRLVLSAIERAYPGFYRRWPLVAPSHGAIADLTSLGFDRSRLNLIGYGVDLEAFRPGTLTETPSVIYFAGLRKYKRPQDALHAFKILRDGGVDADLFVVGHGPQLSSLMKLSRELGLDHHVTFTGRLEDPELRALISRSWVHIQCSVAEGWGLTATEAAASGVPTVAYNVPGLAESVSQGVSGYLVNDGEIPALARAMASVIQHRRDWTVRCRDAVIGHSWNTVGQEWDALLSHLASKQ